MHGSRFLLVAVFAALYCTCLVRSGGAAPSKHVGPFKVVALGTSLTHEGGWLEPLEERLDARRCINRHHKNLLTLEEMAPILHRGVSIIDKVIAERPDVVLMSFFNKRCCLV